MHIRGNMYIFWLFNVMDRTFIVGCFTLSAKMQLVYSTASGHWADMYMCIKQRKFDHLSFSLSLSLSLYIYIYIYMHYQSKVFGIPAPADYLMPNHVYTGCFNIYRTHVTANNSTNNNVFVFVSDLNSITTINSRSQCLTRKEKYFALLLIWRQNH